MLPQPELLINNFVINNASDKRCVCSSDRVRVRVGAMLVARLTCLRGLPVTGLRSALTLKTPPLKPAMPLIKPHQVSAIHAVPSIHLKHTHVSKMMSLKVLYKFKCTSRSLCVDRNTNYLLDNKG